MKTILILVGLLIGVNCAKAQKFVEDVTFGKDVAILGTLTIGGVTVTPGAPAALTPWTSNINAGGYSLTNAAALKALQLLVGTNVITASTNSPVRPLWNGVELQTPWIGTINAATFSLTNATLVSSAGFSAAGIDGISTTWTNMISGVITQRLTYIGGILVTNLTID